MNPYDVNPSGEPIARMRELVRDGMTLRIAEKAHPPRLYTLAGSADAVKDSPRKLVVREIPLWPGDPAATKLKDWDEVLGAMFPIEDAERTKEQPFVRAPVLVGTAFHAWSEGGFQLRLHTAISMQGEPPTLMAVRFDERFVYVPVTRPADPNGGLGE